MLQPYTQQPATRWDLDAPWNRQPCDDSIEAWQAFRAYCAQTHPRNLIQLQRHVVGLDAIRLRCKWEARVNAYDNWLQHEYDRAVAARIAETAQAKADEIGRLLDDGLELAGSELRKLLKVSKESPGVPGLIKPRDLISLVSEFVKLKRLVQGESTERIEIGDVQKIVEGFTYDQLEVLAEMQKRLPQKGE